MIAKRRRSPNVMRHVAESKVCSIYRKQLYPTATIYVNAGRDTVNDQQCQ